ncbi:MAG: hypothetical protein JJ902_04130 [Roseibium sp.]|nr:hypothetical protein [Roseibium sp.]
MTTPGLVKKIRIGRVPGKSITIIDFDGIAFALDERQTIDVTAGTANALVGMKIVQSVDTSGQ